MMSNSEIYNNAMGRSELVSSAGAISNSSSAISSSRICVPLPFGFIPTVNEILCGRGAECLNHEGNQRFRQLIDDNLQIYINSKTKSEKSTIIREIVKRIRNHNGGGFIRKDLLTGQYFEVGEFAAREKISQAFRDALNHKSRSDSIHQLRKDSLICSKDENIDKSSKLVCPKRNIELKRNVNHQRFLLSSAHLKEYQLKNNVEERKISHHNAMMISEKRALQNHQQQQNHHTEESMERNRIINNFINSTSTSDVPTIENDASYSSLPSPSDDIIFRSKEIIGFDHKEKHHLGRYNDFRGDFPIVDNNKNDPFNNVRDMKMSNNEMLTESLVQPSSIYGCRVVDNNFIKQQYE